ncbi:MAG: VCBS repeat-containing protein, partial [Thermoplasmata archaeon]
MKLLKYPWVSSGRARYNRPVRIFTIIILILMLTLNCVYISADPYSEGNAAVDSTAAHSDQSRGLQLTSARTNEDIVINELMISPDKGDVWIELYNSGPEIVPLPQWMISNEDNLTYTFMHVPAFPPENYLVLHFDSGESESKFGQSQPNTRHLYTGWKNVRWTRHVVDSDLYYARYAVGYDLIPGEKPEILANRFGGDRIYFYEALPDGSPPGDWPVYEIQEANAAYRIKPIDIDADGITDVLHNWYFDNTGNSLNWVKGPVTDPKDPWGGFYNIDGLERPEGLDAGDISGDLMMDVVAGYETLNDIYWYECPVDPTIDAWSRYVIDNNLNRPGGLQLADIDSDSDMDIVAVGSEGEDVVWYEHPADPTLAWPKHTIGSKSRGRAVDLEDEIDGNGASSRGSSRTEFDAIGELITVDLDKDNKLEVVVSESKRNRIVFYKSPPDPKNKWTRYVIEDNITGPSGLDAGDFDNDGYVDIAAATTGGAIVWYVHPGQPDLYYSEWPCYVVDNTVNLAFYVNATDVDSDGDLDLITADQNDGKVIWYENQFMEFTLHDQCALYEFPERIPDTMIDFVAWGGTPEDQDDNAVIKGMWNANAFVSLAGAGTNETIARDMNGTDTDLVQDWDDRCGIHSDIPTQGTKNYPNPTNSDVRLEYNPVVFKGAPGGGKSGPPESVPDGVCLANYSSFTFSVNVSNPFGWYDLSSVELTLGPSGADVGLVWTSLNNNFGLMSPSDFVTLVGDACSASSDGIYNWHLNFTVIFHWQYPSESLQDVQLTSRNSRDYDDVDLYTEFYRVVTSLNFSGEMIIRSIDSNKQLYSNDWIIPGNLLRIKGISVIYDIQGGPFYPGDSQFDVLLSDNAGNFWFDYTSAGFEVNFTIKTSRTSSSGPYILNMTLANLAAGAHSNGFASKQLFMDAGMVNFELPSPEEAVWNTQNPVTCSVKITEPESESGVFGSSIQYRIANGSVERFGNWQPHPITGTGDELKPVVSINYTSGPHNWIQWQASDVAGNGPSNSIPFRVLVDTKGVTYHEFQPPGEIIQSSTNVTIQITLADFFGSGVNISTIQAAVKPAGEFDYGNWQTLSYSIESSSTNEIENVETGPETITISASVNSFRNGTDNYIKFRAMDVAGNDYSESEEFNIPVNLHQSRPSVSLVEPASGSIVRILTPSLKWQPQIPIAFQSLRYYVYLSTDSSELDDIDPLDKNIPDTLLTILPGTKLNLDLGSSGLSALEPNKTYYWTVIPVLQIDETRQIVGHCPDGIWDFSVFLGEVGLELSGEAVLIQFYVGESMDTTLWIRNIGKSSDYFTLALFPEGGLELEISNNSVFLESGQRTNLTLTIKAHDQHEGGEFTVTVRANGPSSAAEGSHSLRVKVIQRPKEETEASERA